MIGDVYYRFVALPSYVKTYQLDATRHARFDSFVQRGLLHMPPLKADDGQLPKLQLPECAALRALGCGLRYGNEFCAVRGSSPALLHAQRVILDRAFSVESGTATEALRAIARAENRISKRRDPEAYEIQKFCDAARATVLRQEGLFNPHSFRASRSVYPGANIGRLMGGRFFLAMTMTVTAAVVAGVLCGDLGCIAFLAFAGLNLTTWAAYEVLSFSQIPGNQLPMPNLLLYDDDVSRETFSERPCDSPRPAHNAAAPPFWRPMRLAIDR